MAQNVHVCASTLSPFQENFRGQSKRAIACTDCAATTSESSTPSAFVKHKVHLRRRKPPTRCTLDCGQKLACKNPQGPETARTAGCCERDGVGRPTTSLYLAILSNGSVNIKNVGGRVVKTREWQFNSTLFFGLNYGGIFICVPQYLSFRANAHKLLTPAFTV